MSLMSILGFLLLASLDSHSAEKKHPLCPLEAPISEAVLTNANWLSSFLTSMQYQTKAIKSVEDFVCCLPEVYRQNYIVGRNSIAGQNGDPDNPRVIMFNPNGPLKAAISFNGGGPDLKQALNGGGPHLKQA